MVPTPGEIAVEINKKRQLSWPWAVGAVVALALFTFLQNIAYDVLKAWWNAPAVATPSQPPPAATVSGNPWWWVAIQVVCGGAALWMAFMFGRRSMTSALAEARRLGAESAKRESDNAVTRQMWDAIRVDLAAAGMTVGESYFFINATLVITGLARFRKLTEIELRSCEAIGAFRHAGMASWTLEGGLPPAAEFEMIGEEIGVRVRFPLTKDQAAVIGGPWRAETLFPAFAIQKVKIDGKERTWKGENLECPLSVYARPAPPVKADGA